MSLSAVRQYFRDRMDSLDYEEWEDGFNTENIPQTISEGTYHIETGIITADRANQLTHRFTYPVTIRLFLQGFNDPAATIDRAILASEEILATVLSPVNRLGASINDIFPGTISVVPRDETNDNDIILEMEFNADIICDFS